MITSRKEQQPVAGHKKPVVLRQWRVIDWPLRVYPGFNHAYGRIVRAATKSEARAELKRQFGLPRVPVGAILEELGGAA